MIRGSEVLRSVLPLRVGLEDIAVCAEVTLLVAVNVTVLVVSGWLWRRTGAWYDAILLVECRQLLLMLGDDLRMSGSINRRSQCRGSGGHGVRIT